jgi:hydrogenase maturation protein HypF
MGFDVYVNEQVPAGDAGISVGQAYYLMLKEE